MTTTIKQSRARKRSVEPEKAVIQVSLDAKIKSKVTKLFKQHGLSTSDGMRLLINRALEEKDIPHIPNAETRKAIADADAGKLEEISLADLRKKILGDK